MKTALALSLLPLLASPAFAGDPPRPVKIKTADGLTLEADWYPGEEGMPGIVGLHMYPSDRSSWRPLAEKRPEGWHFLAVDMRGYGGSRIQDGKDLSDRVKKRDATLFAEMWQDALAGVAHLRDEGKCDGRRIGLVGASVGCSVAVDATVRRGDLVASVCALTPGKDYLGVPTMDHVKSWKEQPLLLLSSEEEADGGARPIAAELKRKPGMEFRVVPGEKVHGTNMFGKVAGIEDRIVHWFEATLAREILDGVADAVERREIPGRTVVEPLPGVPGRSILWRVDAHGVNVLVDGPCTAAFVLFVDPDGADDAFKKGGKRLRGTATASGAMTGVGLDTWNEGSWAEMSVGNRPDTAFASDTILEARIPWRMLDLAPAGKTRVGFSPLTRRPDWRAKVETWGAALGRTVEVPQ